MGSPSMRPAEPIHEAHRAHRSTAAATTCHIRAPSLHVTGSTQSPDPRFTGGREPRVGWRQACTSSPLDPSRHAREGSIAPCFIFACAPHARGRAGPRATVGCPACPATSRCPMRLARGGPCAPYSSQTNVRVAGSEKFLQR
jgi:hypothetical protein